MKSLKYLNKYLLKYRFRLLIGVLFVTVSNIFAIFPAQIVRYALDFVGEAHSLYSQYEPFQLREAMYGQYVKIFLLFAGLIILAAVLKGFFMFFMRQTIIVMSRLIEYDLKNEVFDHYQKLSLSFYRRNSTGDLMARISEDVSRVRMYVGPAIMYTINLFVLFVLVIGTMLTVNVKLTLYVLAPLPVLSLSIYYISNIINKKSELVQRQLSGLSTFVQEAFSGIRVLKAYLKEDASGRDFEKESEHYKNESLGLAKVNALFAPFMLLLIGLSTLLTVYIGGIEAIAGNITFGNIAEFIYYVNMLTWPFAAVGWVTSLVQRAAASQQRISEFLNTSPEIVSGTTIGSYIEGSIEFDNVSFVYPDSGIRALRDISLKVEAGRSLAILGTTGSGKSTIANLITRMYDVTAGTIRIDGKDIRLYNLSSLRDQIGYVPQDVFLFSDTIANNIAFGLSIEEKEVGGVAKAIEQAAKDAAIYDNIIAFPEKFQTRIGERGVTLSGGQKQRISIARAIIKRPAILLFDDCLSAVDTQTEEKILDSLKRLMKDRTTILISHRISSVKHADHIIMLRDGQIVEEGDHRSLMMLKGMYAELYEKQLAEEVEQKVV